MDKKEWTHMRERMYKLPLVLEPQPEGGYTITSPVVSELITEADTLDQVIPNVADALAALLELYEDLKRPIPPALQSFEAESDTPIWAEALIPALPA
jgi:antitoxin HicB